MLKFYAVAALMAALIAPAWADTDNLDHAVADARATFKKGGSDALVNKSQICYTGIDFENGHGNQTPGDQAEYCLGFELASSMLINATPSKTNAAYFSPQNLLVRGTAALEKARVITLPEQVNPYIVSRLDYVYKVVHGTN